MARVTKACIILLLVLAIVQLQYQGAVAARVLLQEPAEPNEPTQPRSMDESGFFARLKLDEDGDEPTTGDDDDRRRLLATHSLIAEGRKLAASGRRAQLSW